MAEIVLDFAQSLLLLSMKNAMVVKIFFKIINFKKIFRPNICVIEWISVILHYFKL